MVPVAGLAVDVHSPVHTTFGPPPTPSGGTNGFPYSVTASAAVK